MSKDGGDAAGVIICRAKSNDVDAVKVMGMLASLN